MCLPALIEQRVFGMGVGWHILRSLCLHWLLQPFILMIAKWGSLLHIGPSHWCSVRQLWSRTVGTLENGYVRNVPLPRIPRIQSTSQVADATNWYMRGNTYKFVCNQSIIRIRIYDLVSPRVSSHPPLNKTGPSVLKSRESHVTGYSLITWIPTWSKLSCSPEGFGTIPIVPFFPLVG